MTVRYISLDVKYWGKCVSLTIVDVTVGFEETTYTVEEGMPVTVCIHTLSEVQRDVSVNLNTSDGTASGKINYLISLHLKDCIF